MSPIWFLVVPALWIALLERWWRTRRIAQPFIRARFADDLVFLFLGWVATAKLSLKYVAASSSALHSAGETFDRMPMWLLVVIAIALLDLGNYVSHYLLHRVDALWEFHKVHHSSPTLDWLATFRSHLIEQLLRRVLAPVALIVLGFPLAVVATAGGIFTAWAILNHANIKLGGRVLELLFITPRLHRLHHQPGTSERNLGTVLTVWDRLRGTYVDDDAVGELGVPGEVSTYPQGFLAQLREPFRRLKRHSPPTILICFVLMGCAAPAKQARPPRPTCTWEISGDVPLPRDL